MCFEPYYDIEADRVGRDRELCALASLSPEACYLREAIGQHESSRDSFFGKSIGTRATWLM